MPLKENALVVVALDLGTTYSGWAYSFRKDFKNDSGDIKSTIWKSGEGIVTVKTPTAILFDEDNRFHSFGYEAESKYAELVEDREEEGWKFFKRFKMALFTDGDDEFHHERRKLSPGNISRNQYLKDAKGQKLKSMYVFSATIQYLKDHFLQTLHERANFVGMNDIHWVLTIPAIWSDEAKQFMRMAANQANISNEMLTLAYEPEAAAVFCKTLTIQKKENEYGTFMTSFNEGQRFLVIDCGGGTVDITAYEVKKNDKLEELTPPSGGPWGGTQVDKQFIRLLTEMFGLKVWQEFEKLHCGDALELERKFEAKKRIIGEKNECFERMAFPNSIFEIYKSYTKEEFGTVLNVTKKGDKLKFPINILKNLFEKSFDGIIRHVKELLQKEELANIQMILMVGGFSDSALLYRRIKDEFSGIKVLRPEEAVLSVVKGAVIYGHIPEVVSERACPKTYGIACNIPFDKEIHPIKLRSYYDGREMCTDIFNIIVHKGCPITIGTSSFQVRCLPCRASDSEATVDIFSSSEENPKYTIPSDTLKRLGTLKLDIPDITKGKDRPICIKISFHSTEMSISAVEEGTQNEVRGSFDFNI